MKRKKWKQLLAGTLALGMALSTSTWDTKALHVQAEEKSNEASEWEELSAILDSYPGVYTKDTKFGSPWNTGYNPDGPLMGNGTVYAFMAGDQKEQNLYISHSNLWQDDYEVSKRGHEYTTFGGITIKPDYGENLALSKKVTVCAHNNDNEDGAYLVDGKTNTKWCATAANNGGVSDKYWAVVDLGQDYDISRWVVRHAQAGGENFDYNTKEFKLQYYDGEETPDGAVDAEWKDADAVADNTASVTDRNLKESIHARYVRLLVTKATQGTGTTVRIPELELYAEPGLVNLALGKPATACSSHSDASGPSFMLDGKISSDSKWCSTPSTNNGSLIYWAVVDLEEECDIARWVVKHAQAGGENSAWNTRDFKLQYYAGTGEPDGAVEEQWTDADVVTGNTESVTDRNLEQPIKARYVRLLVTKATQNDDNAVRIPEMELYAEPGEIQENAQEFRYEQDMKNAEVTAQSKNGFTTVNWVSAKENIIVTEITNVTEMDLPLEVTAWTANRYTDAKVEGNKMVTTKAGVSDANENYAFADGTWEGWTVNIAMASQIIGDVDVTIKNVDNHKNRSTFTLAPGQKVTLVSAIEGGKQDDKSNSKEQAIEKATNKLDTRLTQEALDTSKQKHRDYWKNYWMKSYIDIQDASVERMYYGMMYQLGCATSVSSENNGGTAAGLFPWTAANHPAWRADYTTNTDFQRQIHPLVTANRTEGIENYLNIIEQFWPDAERRAQSVQDLNWVIEGTGRPLFTEGIEGGALFPTHIGPWGAATERNYSFYDYWNSPADATAVLMPVVKEWKYTLDEALLERLYPMMKSVSIFWENYVTLENGKYVVYGATHEGIKGRNAILDVDACKYMLKNTILAAKELGKDQDKVEIWQNILDNMSPVPTFIYNGKETICDVEGRTQNNTGYTFNGNPVTIQSVYYYDSIGMSASDEEKAKYFNYLAKGNGKGSHRRLISATRLGYDINDIMEQMKSGSINPSPSDWSGLRGNNTIGDIGAAAMTGLIQDSLIQSNEGFINIFANWFDNQETRFRGLRTENAFLVDADMDEYGQVVYVKIHSDKGKDCSVLNPWSDKEMEVYENGKKIKISSTEENSLGTVYTFATKAGADYELKPADGLQRIFELNKEELELNAGTIGKLSISTNVENPNLLWTSEDPEVAIVGNDGTVLALKEGTTVVKVSITEEELSAECKVTVQPQQDLANVAPKGTATASSQLDNNLDANKAIDGDHGVFGKGKEGWVSQNESWDNVNARWLRIDLAQEYDIERWVLYHDGWRSGAKDPASHAGNWGNYSLQVSSDGETWVTIDSKIDNKDNVTDKTLSEPVRGRYFRIYMEFPMFKSNTGWQWSSGMARLNQVELYTKAEDPEAIKATEVSKLSDIEVSHGTAFDNLNLPKTITAKLSNDMSVDFPVSWEKGNYNGNVAGEYILNGTLQLPEGITNPDNLTAVVTVKVNASLANANKTLLQATYDYALSLSTDGVVDSAKTFFEKALANAKAVLEKEDATQEEVNAVWDNLLEGIWGLGIVKGDTTMLEMLIERADAMAAEQDRYVQDNWQQLADALVAAKEVVNDGDALEEDIQPAADALLDAILAQRYKANKDNLKNLIDKAEGLDLSKYTKESVMAFRAALKAANAVMADESLSTDDQAQVDKAAKELQIVIDGLKLASNDGDNSGNDNNANSGNGDKANNGTSENKTTNTGKNAPKTGDTMNVAVWLMLMAVVIAAGRVSVRSKRR